MLRLLGILALGNLLFGGNRRRRGSLLGGLLALPMLMFGGWIALAVVGGVLGLVGSVIGGIFSGLGALASGVFSGGGVVIGILIGLVLYFRMRKNSGEQEAESCGTVDGEEAETEIAEPRYERMNG